MKQMSTLQSSGLLSILLVGCTGSIDGSANPMQNVGGQDAQQEGPAGQAGSPAANCASGPSVAPGRMRRLTTVQYRNATKDLLGVDADTTLFLTDSRSGPFATNAQLPPQANDIDQYRTSAEKLAAQATVSARLETTVACSIKDRGEDTCAQAFISDFGKRAYRRPLTTNEVATFTSVYKLGKEESFATGIGLVIEAALQSPKFLYLPEFGAEGNETVSRLTGPEMASRLSFLLWSTTPDRDLTSAAESGKLDSVEGVRAQAERLLASDRFVPVATSFHAQLLGIDSIDKPGSVTKNATLFPEFTQEMRSAMANETKRFVEHVMTKGDGTVETLLTAPYSFPSGPLLKLYGLKEGAPPADGRYESKDGTRFGLLTQASFLTAHPGSQSLFPAVARGKEIRINLLCTNLPAPPAAAKFEPPPNADKLSQQELMRRHMDDPSCSPCHTLMEPVGFGLDNYDAIGRYRTTAPDGTTFNASGDIMDTDVSGAYSGAKELAQRLARSEDVRGCMASQWFEYTLGRPPGQEDACSMDQLNKVFKEGGGDIRRGLLTFVQSDAFRFHRGE